MCCCSIICKTVICEIVTRQNAVSDAECWGTEDEGLA